MNERLTTRQYLETLSTTDLLARAKILGLDLPPELNRNFAIQEILEAEYELTNPSSLESLTIKDIADGQPAIELPRWYNETYLTVLPRDPLWAYVFWEIRQSEKENCEKAAGFVGYRLRVVTTTKAAAAAPPKPSSRVAVTTQTSAESNSQPKQANLNRPTSFIVPVDKADYSWYLCLPPETGWYRVDLCAQTTNGLEVLVSSPTFRVPGGWAGLCTEGENLAEPIRLSVMAGLGVLRQLERLSRRLKRCRV